MPKLVLDKPKRLRLVLDEPEDVALHNDPNDVTIQAEESLSVADNLELPLIQAEEIVTARNGEKLERPGLFKRGVFGFVNKAFVQPVKNVFKYGGMGNLDISLEMFGEVKRIKDKEGRDVGAEEFLKIGERTQKKVHKRVQTAGPNLELPKAEGVAEKGLEVATGLGAFITKLMIARKFVGGSGTAAEIAAFEAVNQVDNGPPGLGVLLAGSLGLIGKVPAATLGGKGLKLAGQGGALATITAARGGEPEDIAVAFFLPAILQTFNQFPNLVKGKAWDIKTAKGAQELGIFKGVPIKNVKQWSAAMRDAAKVKAGTMTPKKWGAKHGKNLQDFSDKVGKTYEDVAKMTGELAKPVKPPAKAVKKAPSKPVKAKAPPKAKITPVQPKAAEVAAEGKYTRTANEIQTSIKAKEFSVKEFVAKHGDKAAVYQATQYLLEHPTYPQSISKTLLSRIKAIQKEAKKQGVGIGEVAPKRTKLLTEDEVHSIMSESLDKNEYTMYLQDELQARTKGDQEAATRAFDKEAQVMFERGYLYNEKRNQWTRVSAEFKAEVEKAKAQPVAKAEPKTAEQKAMEEVGKKPSGMYNLAEQKAWEKKYWAAVSRYAAKEKPPEGKTEIKTHWESRYDAEGDIVYVDWQNKRVIKKGLNKGTRYPVYGSLGKFRTYATRKAINDRYTKLAQPVTKPKKPKLKPIPEEKDILGGVDPLNQIHTALKAAKAVRPITEAAKKAALKARVGAAAGALRAGLKKGMPAEQAILKSTGLLKGPLTEYDQVYESIEDTLEPGAKDAAYQMIARHPDLKYFEVVNTQKSFQKLLAGSDLTPKDAENIERVFGKVFDDIVKPRTKKSELYERLIATWKAGLLTGMKTSGLNILSTASHAVSETAKDVPASLVDSGVALVTGERTVAFTAKGYGFGFKEGLGKGWRYMKTGHDERNVLEKYDYKKTNFGTSKKARAQQAYVEFVFHLLGAEDQPFYYGALSRSLYSQAIAQAKNKGLKGKERQAFVNNIQKNPTDDMLELAKEDAEGAIYTNRTHLGDVAKSIQKVKGGEVVVPFGRTPSAVAMQIINYSPVGVVKEISEQIHKGKFNQRKFSHAAGRTVVGTGALYLGAQLFKAGLIALGYPDNERERKLWELDGRKPNSIKIDDEWRDIQAFGPLGNLLIIGGYFQQALDSKGSPTQAMVEAMTGGAKSFTEQTFVRGVNLAVDALTDPEASFERWFTSMSGSLVPTIVADIARAQDDRARLAVGPKERIQSRIPIYRRGLPPKIDVFGQDLPRYGGNVLETMADPTRPSKIRQDVVVDELRRLWDKDVKVSPTLLGDKAGYDILTKEENTQLWRRAGELTYKGLFAAINSEGYEDTNDFAKGKLLDMVVRSAKTAAKLEIVIIKKEQGKTIMQLAESGLFAVEEFEMLKYFQGNPIE